MKSNILNATLSNIVTTDSYKTSHWKQYPSDVEFISSYIEPRWNKDGNITDVVFFGLQAYLKSYLANPITMEDIEFASEFFEAHGVPFNREGWEYILSEHGGYLPVEISALPEGTVHKIGVPQVQVVNTDPKVPWITSYIETALIRGIWYPSTVASISRKAKNTILNFLKKTSDLSLD